jgi:hypothetical protein
MDVDAEFLRNGKSVALKSDYNNYYKPRDKLHLPRQKSDITYNGNLSYSNQRVRSYDIPKR